MEQFTLDQVWKRGWMAAVVLALVLSACGAPPSPVITASTAAPTVTMTPAVPPDPPTATPIPPTQIPPTATPMPGPRGYLLTLADFPPGFVYSFIADNLISAKAEFLSARYLQLDENGNDTADLRVMVNVAESREALSEKALIVRENYQVVEIDRIGDESVAYLTDGSPARTGITFIKGNVQVELYGQLPMEQMAALAQVIAGRIPAQTAEILPLSFPQTLDAALAAQTFRELALGKCDQNDQVFNPLTVFTAEDKPLACLKIDLLDADAWQTIQWKEYAILNLETQAYVFKYGTPYGFGVPQLLQGPGKYELHVALDGVLVAVFPFEIQ